MLAVLYWASLALTGMRAGLAGGGARNVTLIPVGANADWYESAFTVTGNIGSRLTVMDGRGPPGHGGEDTISVTVKTL